MTFRSRASLSKAEATSNRTAAAAPPIAHPYRLSARWVPGRCACRCASQCSGARSSTCVAKQYLVRVHRAMHRTCVAAAGGWRQAAAHLELRGWLLQSPDGRSELNTVQFCWLGCTRASLSTDNRTPSATASAGTPPRCCKWCDAIDVHDQRLGGRPKQAARLHGRAVALCRAGCSASFMTSYRHCNEPHL